MFFTQSKTQVARRKPQGKNANQSQSCPFGSEQEFVRSRILGRFLENHEFSFGGCHALGFQQQVREILVAAAAA